jgi:hypothetical protein
MAKGADHDAGWTGTHVEQDCGGIPVMALLMFLNCELLPGRTLDGGTRRLCQRCLNRLLPECCSRARVNGDGRRWVVLIVWCSHAAELCGAGSVGDKQVVGLRSPASMYCSSCKRHRIMNQN